MAIQNLWHSFKDNGTPLHIGNAVKDFKRLRPREYQEFFPRIYKDTDRFCDYRIPALLAARAHVHIQDKLKVAIAADKAAREVDLTLDVMVRSLYQWIAEWFDCGLPIHFIERSLFDAASKTAPPDGILLRSLRMPFPGMTFVLPKEAMKFNGYTVAFIGVAQTTLLTGSHNSPLIPVTPWFVVCAAFVEVTEYMVLSAPIHEVELGLRKGWDAMNVVGDIEIVQDGANQLFMDALRIAINLILAMEARPELLVRERKLHAHKKDIRREVWQPNVIGSKYKIQYSGGVTPGTHASPRMHWRCGHFRRQGIGHRITTCGNCGESREVHAPEPDSYCMKPNVDCDKYILPKEPFSEYKTIWIEPVLVAGREKQKENHGQPITVSN